MDMPAAVPAEVRYIGDAPSDGAFHDGGLRPATGVHRFQVARAGYGEGASDGRNSGYRRHPRLAFFQGRLLVHYLTEYEGALAWADLDAPRAWRTAVSFPSVNIEGKRAAVHARMAFYRSSRGRMRLSVFCGPTGKVNAGAGGYARVVRELRGFVSDGAPQLGPIYAALFNGGCPSGNTPWPHFTAADDADFREAAAELLSNSRYVQQWREEQRNHPEAAALFVVRQGESAGFDGKAFCWWSLPDERIAAIWKGPWTTVARDGIRGWTADNAPLPRRAAALRGWLGTSKIWGQRLGDGTYVLVGNHQTTRADGRLAGDRIARRRFAVAGGGLRRAIFQRGAGHDVKPKTHTQTKGRDEI